MPEELELRYCNPWCCSALLSPPSSPVIQKEEVKWSAVCFLFFWMKSLTNVKPSSKQTNLCKSWFVDTVNIRFGLLFNFSSKCFVTDCTVYQRLHECTQTKQHRQVRTGIRPGVQHLSSVTWKQPKLTLSFLNWHAVESTVPFWHLVALT